MIFLGADRPDFHASSPLVLRYGQRIDVIVAAAMMAPLEVRRPLAHAHGRHRLEANRGRIDVRDRLTGTRCSSARLLTGFVRLGAPSAARRSGMAVARL
jgi:hypothetical protein